MLRKIALAAVLALPLMANAGYVAIQNFEHNTLTTLTGEPATEAQVREAIVRGSAKRGWVLKEEGPGKFTAFIDVRGKHQLTMMIIYGPSEFSLSYVGSVNLERNGKIHDKYLMWSGNLIKDIRSAMMTNQL